MIRLLPKSEIQKAKASAQKQTIDEGLKLARRVDGLRETVSEEEKALEEFRVTTIKRIYSEIETVAVKRDDLLAEVKDLEKRKAEALKPLDKEWEEVNNAKVTVATELEVAGEKLDNALEAEKKAKELLKDTRTANERARTREEEAVNKVTDAIRIEKEAKVILDEANQKLTEATGAQLSADANIAERTKNLDLREESLRKREAQVEEDRIENATVRAYLEDREKTLEREFKRLKK